MKDLIKKLYVFYFSKKGNKEVINDVMVDLEYLTDEYLTQDEILKCLNKTNGD